MAPRCFSLLEKLDATGCRSGPILVLTLPPAFAVLWLDLPLIRVLGGEPVNPIRFTLLISLLAILMAILAALFAPSGPANQVDYSGANQLLRNRLDQPPVGGAPGKRTAPADCAPNCFP